VWRRAVKRNKKETAYYNDRIKSGKLEIPWWSSAKGLHKWKGKKVARQQQSRRVNFGAPLHPLETPFFGSNFTFITKSKIPYDVTSPFIKSPRASKRRRYRLRRPLNATERCNSRKERLIQNAKIRNCSTKIMYK